MRFIPPIILVTALCLTGCSSTVTGTAESAGGGASGTSSAPPSKEGSPSTSSSPRVPQTRTSTYDTSLVGVADVSKGTAYTAISLTPDKLVPVFDGLASQVTSTPSGRYFTPAESKDVLTADGTALAGFKQPNGDGAIEVIVSDALVDRDAFVKKANECASFTAKGLGASVTGAFTTSTTTDSKTGLLATLISRTIFDGTVTGEEDSIIGYSKGAVAVLLLSFYKAGNPDQKLLVAKMTAIILARLAAAQQEDRGQACVRYARNGQRVGHGGRSPNHEGHHRPLVVQGGALGRNVIAGVVIKVVAAVGCSSTIDGRAVHR